MNRVLLSFLSLVFIADGLMVFLIPVLVYTETQSLTYSGLAYALWWLPRIILIPTLGSFIDRWGVRPISIATDAIKSLGCLLLCLVLNFADQPLTIAVTAGLLGAAISIGNAQTIVSFEKLIATLSHHIERDSNRLTRLDLLGMVVGPLLGMLLYEYGFMTLLFIAATLYLCNAYYFLTFKMTPASNVSDFIAHPSFISLLTILKKPFILLMVLLVMGNNMFDGLIESAGSAVIETNMVLPVKYFGLIDMCAGAIGFLATFFYSTLINRLNKESLLFIGLCTIIVSSLLLSRTLNNLIAFLIFYSLSTAGKVFTGNIMRVMRIAIIPHEKLASVSSIMVLLNQSILPFMWLFLFLSEHYSLPITLFLHIAITISLLAGMGMLFALRKIDTTAPHIIATDKVKTGDF